MSSHYVQDLQIGCVEVVGSVMHEGRVVIGSVMVLRHRPEDLGPPSQEEAEVARIHRGFSPDEVAAFMRGDEAGAVTAEVLRTITVEWFIHLVQHLVYNEQDEDIQDILAESNVARLRDNGPTTESLEVVADVYRLAYAVGMSPTKRVEDVFSLPRSTTGRWVAMARKRGLLGEAPRPGKAGA